MSLSEPEIKLYKQSEAVAEEQNGAGQVSAVEITTRQMAGQMIAGQMIAGQNNGAGQMTAGQMVGTRALEWLKQNMRTPLQDAHRLAIHARRQCHPSTNLQLPSKD
jgi:hypothetical protein